jgi:hypothetical protein
MPIQPDAGPRISPLGQRRQALALADQVHEAAEQIVAVLRAGRGFRVMLHREHRLSDQPQTAIGAVEQRDMGLLDAFGQALESTAKPWFIDTISTLPVV